jgi:hypothetical protein
VWSTCPRCGGPISGAAAFCGTCGATTPAGGPPTPVPPSPQPDIHPALPSPPPSGRGFPLLLIALGSCIVIAVLAVAAMGTGLLRSPGTTSPAENGSAIGDAASAAPIESPPAIDHLAAPITGDLTLGTVSTIATIPLAADGARVTVTAPGESWDGLAIDIPTGAWPGATLSVSATPIEGSTFGDLVTPISPLISVSGAEGMAPLAVTVRIPAIVPADSFAMGFFYDGSGHLEGMPLLAEDAGSVTVATRHFSGGFISLVKRSLLSPTVDSGFRPGKDDWQFPNMGSFIASDGHCAGQVLTEAYYYIERRMKSDAAPLYGLYDNNGDTATPTLWQDDSDGYRLASVAQHQYETAADDAINELLGKLRPAGFDALQYDAFRYAIAVTGEPQVMSISDVQDDSGHVILAYRVAPGEIFVADPNFPAAWKRVPYDAAAGTFGNYLSALSREEIEKGHPTVYTHFAYKAKSAMVDWPALAADWTAFDAGTIGDGVFPTLVLETMDDAAYAQGQTVWVPLTDGYRTSDKVLPVRLGYPGGVNWRALDIYRGTSDELISSDTSQPPYLELSEGDNLLGFYETAKVGQDSQYVDFVRLHVVFDPAVASATPAIGGRWTLTKTAAGGGSNATSYSKVGEKMTVESSSGRVAVSYDYDGPPHLNETSSFSWTPPPAAAAPGDVWTSTLEAQGTCTFDAADLQSWGGSVGWLALWSSAGEKMNKMSETAGTDCQHASGSAQTSWTFPVHDEFSGDALEISVSAGDSNGSDDWTYTYTWEP